MPIVKVWNNTGEEPVEQFRLLVEKGRLTILSGYMNLSALEDYRTRPLPSADGYVTLDDPDRWAESFAVLADNGYSIAIIESTKQL